MFVSHQNVDSGQPTKIAERPQSRSPVALLAIQLLLRQSQASFSLAL
jgi:hypothetical protein